MSLAHDLAESIVGDITPSDGVSKEEKYLREKVATPLMYCQLRQSPLHTESFRAHFHTDSTRGQ